MTFRLKTYGRDAEEVVLETTEKDPEKIKAIKDRLPMDVQARLIGHRILPALAIP